MRSEALRGSEKQRVRQEVEYTCADGMKSESQEDRKTAGLLEVAPVLVTLSTSQSLPVPTLAPI